MQATLLRILRHEKYGVTIVTRIAKTQVADCRTIAKFKNRKRLALKPKLDQKEFFGLTFRRN
jgi:hypothetical protein